MPALYGPEKAKNEFKTLEGFVRTFFKEYESTNSRAASYYEGGGFGSSSFGSGLSTEYRGGFKKFLSDIENEEIDQSVAFFLLEINRLLGSFVRCSSFKTLIVGQIQAILL
ncbi:hypothetical protein L6452_00030 [Arctium lappa]|uniref:Uncharacterized protein n=1 Tax=Arctium lappa TaxID=4217 RepID=A0ACB9FCV6_ARCLA|nr:hypothetical protein L6452_00030 [Arctium lappa]